MSRLGRQPITIPKDSSVKLDSDSISVTGPKGQLTQKLHPLINIKQENDELNISRKNDTKFAKSLQGTYHRLISNMITGTTQGFQKTLELVGTGYRVAAKGKKISLSLGFSHPVEYQSPDNITIQIEGNNKITVSGTDKQLVGQIAAQIRAFKKPEPYKGKGIRYQGEVVRRKAGKAAKTAEA